MNSVFFDSFVTVGQAVGSILLIVLLGGWLVRRGYVENDWIKGLAGVTVNVFTPALIFSKLLRGFDADKMPYWWLIPLMTVAAIAATLAVGLLFFASDFRRKSALLGVASLQNANYLVLPIGLLLYPDRFDEFATYVFLVVLGISPVLWSVGKFLVTPREGVGFQWRNFVSPPFFANFLGIAGALMGWDRYLPQFLLRPIEMIGEAAVPSGNFILGATLGAISLRQLPPLWDVLRVVVLKYLFLPVLAFVLVYVSGLKQSNPMLAELAVIQAAVAPASALIIMVRNYGGDAQQVGGHMLITYLLTIVSVPFWLSALRAGWWF